MSFLLWQRGGDTRMASARLVLRAAEVPLLAEAQHLRDSIERLHAERERLVAESAARGYADGHAQGLDAGRRDGREEIAATLVALAHSSAQEREGLRGEVGALALQVVRKLLGHFAEDAVLVALAAVAANDLVATQPVALVVHPSQCQAVRERLATAADGDLALRCEVRGDPGAALDCCRIETEHGSVEASLEAQLARLEAAWAQAAPRECAA